MNITLPTLRSKEFVTICAEHTRRVQLLADKFWNGDIDLGHYRKQSRGLTQQFLEELQGLFSQSTGHYPASTKTSD